MKQIILAVDNKKLERKIKENSQINIFGNKLQYREAILEILQIDKDIDFILIDEKLPGMISIEKLIKNIQKINSKIKIIFFLEKRDIKKEKKLKNFKIDNIYLNKKINVNNVIHLISNKKTKRNNIVDNFKKIFNENKMKYESSNYKNRIITVMGQKKTGKSTIVNLLLIYLLKKRKKILLININKKIENNYLFLIGKKQFNKNYKFNKIKINNNLIYFNNFEKQMKEGKFTIKEFLNEQNKNNYDYILIDIGDNANRKIKNEILKISDKKIKVISPNLLGIKGLKQTETNVNLKRQIPKNSLHIIVNKYYFNSISGMILKKIIGKNNKFSIIFYNKKIKNLKSKKIKNEEIKINLILENKIKNILEKN